MGFRKDVLATVWSVEPVSDTITKARISTSRKNKQTEEYDTDFSGFVGFVGTAAAKKAARLKEKDRIRLGDVEVTNKYDKEKKVTYTNFTVFDFKTQVGFDDAPKNAAAPEPKKPADDGELDDANLPF
jgi:hypothetical protein